LVLAKRTRPTDPKDSGLRVIRIPKTIGGRLYFSLAEPVTLSVVEGKSPEGRAVSLTLAEPTGPAACHWEDKSFQGESCRVLILHLKDLVGFLKFVCIFLCV
jgi:hypothetical protein